MEYTSEIMKICLVAPRNPPSFWTFDRILPSLNKKCVFPNLSLPTVAGITPREHEVVLCDENVEPIDFDTDADIVGLTGYVDPQDSASSRSSAEFRRRGKFVVIGGPLASLCPEELRGNVDVLFVDEAEYTWPQFLRDYAAGHVAQRVPAGRKAEHARLAAAALRPAARSTAIARMTIQFTRGCPFTCEFCDIIVMYGRRPRAKTGRAGDGGDRGAPSPWARATSSSSTTTSSATRSSPRSCCARSSTGSKRHDQAIEFMTEVSLNVAQDDELLRLLRDANFTTIFIGIESPRAASLEETHEDTRTSARTCSTRCTGSSAPASR